MVRFKKLAAVLLSAVMLVCCFTVQASAKSVFDKAVKLSPMELASGTFKNNTEFYYKVVLPDSGKITFYCVDRSVYEYKPVLSLIDSNGATIISSDGMGERTDREYVI